MGGLLGIRMRQLILTSFHNVAILCVIEKLYMTVRALMARVSKRFSRRFERPSGPV